MFAVVVYTLLALLVSAQEQKLETLFFTQCACEDDIYVSNEQSLFPNAFVRFEEDGLSCPPPTNPLSGFSDVTGTLVSYEDLNALGGQTTNADSSFFVDDNGVRASVFFRTSFTIPNNFPSGVDFLEAKLFEIPELRMETDITIRILRVNFNNIEVTASNVFFNFDFPKSETEFEVVAGEQVISSTRREVFLCLKTNSRNLCLDFRKDDLVQVPAGNETKVDLLFSDGDFSSIIDAPLTFIPNFLQLGTNFLNEAEVASVDDGTFTLKEVLEAKFNQLPAVVPPSLPKVISNELKALRANTLDLNVFDLVEEVFEDTLISLDFSNILGEAILSENFANDGTFTYTPPDGFIGTEVFQMTVSFPEPLCERTFDVSIEVEETEAPTSSPTFAPSGSPTLSPTANPSASPTFSPTFAPTDTPEELSPGEVALIAGGSVGFVAIAVVLVALVFVFKVGKKAATNEEEQVAEDKKLTAEAEENI